MMATKLKLVSMVPLKQRNYATWKLQCQMMLMKENLWGIISQTENPPGDSVSVDVIVKYRARKDQALATILLSVYLTISVVFTW